MSASSPLFEGVYTAVVTPFHDDGSLDLEGYRALLEDQIQGGVTGIVTCGTTGEASTMSREERAIVIKTTVETVKGRVPVIAGAGANDTRVALEQQAEVKALGADASLQVTPWYNKPTQEGLFRHFSAIVAGAPLPTILYNVPGRTSVDMLPETVERLARAHENIVAVKEATGSIQRAQDILCRMAPVRSDFSVLSGDDGFILGLVAIGGHGVISVTSHLCVEDLVAMIAAQKKGDHARAQALSRKVNPLAVGLFFRANPIPVKAALAMTRLKGKLKDNVRLPLVPLDDKDRAELQGILARAGYG
jgi:4-hydroxy-tetrahydrodipicolinate synthase